LAGRDGIDAVPGFASTEERDAEVAVQVERVAVRGDETAVGVAGFGIVEMAFGEVVGVGLHEAGANDQAAEGAVSEGGVGILLVGGFRRVG
jgi:hypothetical protein